MARPLCGFQIQMIQSPHIYQWMGMSVSFGKHWAKCCQDHLVSLSKQLPLRPRNNSSTVALLRLTHFFWPKIHGVLGAPKDPPQMGRKGRGGVIEGRGGAGCPFHCCQIHSPVKRMSSDDTDRQGDSHTCSQNVVSSSERKYPIICTVH